VDGKLPKGKEKTTFKEMANGGAGLSCGCHAFHVREDAISTEDS